MAVPAGRSPADSWSPSRSPNGLFGGPVGYREPPSIAPGYPNDGASGSPARSAPYPARLPMNCALEVSLPSRSLQSWQSCWPLCAESPVLWQDFDGHLMAQVGVLSTIDLSHATLAFLFDDFVMGKCLAEQETPPHRAMQLCLMSRAEGFKGSGSRQRGGVPLRRCPASGGRLHEHSIPVR